MQHVPEHSKRCEQALRPVCVCSVCGGSLHGWTGHLERARRGKTGVEELREPAETRWREQRRHFEESRSRTPTKYLRRAGGAVVVSGTIAWLAEHRTGVERVEKLGTVLNENIRRPVVAVRRTVSRRQTLTFTDYGRTVVGHFWYTLLTRSPMSWTGREADQQAPEGLKEAVLEHEDAADWGPTRTELAGEALNLLWKSAQQILGPDRRPQPCTCVSWRSSSARTRGPPCGTGLFRPLATDILGEYLGVEVEPEWLWKEPR